MAESEGPTVGGGGGTGAIDGCEGGGVGGGGGGGARAILGGSLPPRKRLLAGLKQNRWMAASTGGSSPAAGTVMVAGVGGGGSVERGGGGGGGAMAAHGPSGGGGEAIAVVEGAKVEGCMSCGAVESGAWRRLKRNGVIQRLCNSCTLLFNRNMNCPHCLMVYPDGVKDPAIWLQCCRCQRSVHMECEKTRVPVGGVALDSSAYNCPECVQTKKNNNAGGVQGSVRTTKGACGGGGVRIGVNCNVEAGTCASSAAAECSSPCSKKARMHRDQNVRIIKTCDADTAAQEPTIERICPEAKTGLGRKGVSSQEAAAAAAAAAAATACRAAQVAKALAAAKAAAAVKAASLAKAALDAAALAARAEAQARADIRRNSGSSESIISKHDAAFFRKERAEKPDVKIEGEDIHGGFPPNIDDEELARQLHRAINSSPRISRSLTPLRRKAVPATGAKAGTESVRAWPRSQGLSSPPTGPRHHQCAKHQQTRPRSLVGGHKEVKRLDSRVMRKPEDMGTLKSEPADSSTVSHVRQDYSTGPHDFHNAPPDMLKGNVDCQFGGVSEVYSGGNMSHEMRLSDAEGSQAAALLDEVLMSEEADQQAALVESCLSVYGDGEAAPVLDSHWQMEGNAVLLEQSDGANAVDAGQDTMAVNLLHSDVSASNPTAGEGAVNGRWSSNEDAKCKSETAVAQDISNKAIQDGSLLPAKEELPIKSSNGSQELDGSPSQLAAAQGQARHQGVVKGLSGGGKSFASGGHFSSAPSIPT